MIVSGILLLLPFVWFVARRRKRARVLAGLVATRPTFTVEPPRRALGRASGERL